MSTGASFPASTGDEGLHSWDGMALRFTPSRPSSGAFLFGQYTILLTTVLTPCDRASDRYLGGLLGAYDLSGDSLLLKRAEELGKIILPVFDTSSGVPLSTLPNSHSFCVESLAADGRPSTVPGRINPKEPKHNYAGHAIQLAEAGTLALEYTRLSQLTGNRTYFDLAQRGMDYLDQVLAPKSPFPPLLPTMFSTETWRGGTLGTYSFGGMSDSAVEYLIKQSVLLEGRLCQTFVADQAPPQTRTPARLTSSLCTAGASRLPTSKRFGDLSSPLARNTWLQYSQSIDRATAILFKEPKVPGKNLLVRHPMLFV